MSLSSPSTDEVDASSSHQSADVIVRNSLRPARIGASAWRALVPFGALIALIIVFAVISPSFLTLRNGINVASQSSVLLIIALGSAFVILMGSIDLSVGAIASLAGIVAAKVSGQYGESALFAALAVGLIAGLANGLLFTGLRIPSFLVTLGTMSLLSGIGLFLTDSVPVSVLSDSYAALANHDFFGYVPALIVWALAIYVVAIAVAAKTRFGRYVYAMGGGERVAVISGVPVRRYKVYTFMVSGALAGIGGGLLSSWLQVGGPTIGQGDMLSSIAAVVMGGIPLNGGYGAIGRTLLGVLVIGVLSNGMNLAGVNLYFQIVIQGIVIIAAVAFSLDRSRLSVLK